MIGRRREFILGNAGRWARTGGAQHDTFNHTFNMTVED
jgi:hypothetical protein